MPKKRYKPEEMVAKLRQVDVHLSQGISVTDAIRQIGVSDVTYYRVDLAMGRHESVVIFGEKRIHCRSA